MWHVLRESLVALYNGAMFDKTKAGAAVLDSSRRAPSGNVSVWNPRAERAALRAAVDACRMSIVRLVRGP